MKIAVLGSNGMAGHMVTRYFRENGYDVTTFARTNADNVLDVESPTIRNLNLDDFEYVINCIGLLVKDSKERPDRAALINAWFPHFLEQKLIGKGKLIHLSTDCVFDGSAGPYIETDFHSETNAYGRSKSFGEVNNNKDITFRMSIIGPELKNGTGLFHWFMNNKSPEVEGWENAMWSGITTLELALALEQYIKRPTESGVYHLVSNNCQISKYDLLVMINDIFNGGFKKIIRTRGPKNINKILIDTKQTLFLNIAHYELQLFNLKKYLKV